MAPPHRQSAVGNARPGKSLVEISVGWRRGPAGGRLVRFRGAPGRRDLVDDQVDDAQKYLARRGRLAARPFLDVRGAHAEALGELLLPTQQLGRLPQCPTLTADSHCLRLREDDSRIIT